LEEIKGKHRDVLVTTISGISILNLENGNFAELWVEQNMAGCCNNYRDDSFGLRRLNASTLFVID
jgi:hypothetical protein